MSETAKVGRPSKPFDPVVFEGLCEIQCTTAEILAVLNLSLDTVERRCKEIYNKNYAEVYNEKAANGKISLRRWQMKAAQEGSVAMQIWLGKLRAYVLIYPK